MFISIRRCEIEDLPSVYALYRQLHREDTTSLVDMEKVFWSMREYPECNLMVVGTRSGILGTFVLYVLPNMTHFGRSAAIIENIVVDEAYRGKGIGRAMLEYSCNYAKARNCYKLSLTSNAKREDAHEFYRRCGMIQHGVSFRYEL